MVDRDSKHAAKVGLALAKVQHANGDLSRATNRLRREVGAARAAGATWAELGALLGITGQGVQKRYGTKEERAQALELREARRVVARLRKRVGDSG